MKVKSNGRVLMTKGDKEEERSRKKAALVENEVDVGRGVDGTTLEHCV